MEGRARTIRDKEKNGLCLTCYGEACKGEGVTISVETEIMSKSIMLSFRGDTYNHKDEIKTIYGTQFTEIMSGIFGVFSEKGERLWIKRYEIEGKTPEQIKAIADDIRETVEQAQKVITTDVYFDCKITDMEISGMLMVLHNKFGKPEKTAEKPTMEEKKQPKKYAINDHDAARKKYLAAINKPTEPLNIATIGDWVAWVEKQYGLHQAEALRKAEEITTVPVKTLHGWLYGRRKQNDAVIRLLYVFASVHTGSKDPFPWVHTNK